MRLATLVLSGIQVAACTALLILFVLVLFPQSEGTPSLLHAVVTAPYVLLLLLALLPLILAIRGRARRIAFVLSLLAFGLLLFYLAIQFGLVFEAPPVVAVP